jgi:type VI protein secretion system component VasK
MNNIRMILKIAALAMVLVGLLSMLVAWQLLLVSDIHSTTVIVLEMGGVIVCMAGYFLWRRVRMAEKEEQRQIQALPSEVEDGLQE